MPQIIENRETVPLKTNQWLTIPRITYYTGEKTKCWCVSNDVKESSLANLSLRARALGKHQGLPPIFQYVSFIGLKRKYVVMWVYVGA